MPLSHIRFLTHQKKQVLFVDLSNCTAEEVEKIVRTVPDLVSSQPPKSVLILSDFTGATFDHNAIRAMQESAVFDKPFVKKSAWIGAANFPQLLYENLKTFSGRDFPVFKSRHEALDWLVKD